MVLNIVPVTVKQFVGEMTIVSPDGLREEYKKRAAQVAEM